MRRRVVWIVLAAVTQAAVTLAAVTLAAATGTATSVAAGEWSTSYGPMQLPDLPRPGPLRAAYGDDDGRLIGDLVQAKCLGCGLAFEGFWVEAGSDKTCGTAVDGSRHWGQVTLEFDAAYRRFTGSWDYCGTGVTHAWEGHRDQGG